MKQAGRRTGTIRAFFDRRRPVVLATTFWETFFLFLIFLPLAMVWAFAFVDIFRRDDISGGSKALWVTCVLVLPFVGTLVYLVTRPSGATREERAMIDVANRELAANSAPSNGMSELATLADLHDRGKLTDDEFAAEKARILGTATPLPV
jgi:Phospholipase_D-nuclease N-terminal/Short C-terminal domain